MGDDHATEIADYGASAVDYMWGYFGDWDKSQLIRIRANNGTYAGFDFNRQYYVMGQYSKFVRPGAVRVGATSAAARREGRRVSSPARTRSSSPRTRLAAADRPFELGSGPCLTHVDPTRTSETEGLQALPTITLDQSASPTTLPPKSVTTFVGR